MNQVIDIGNTLLKTAVFEGELLVAEARMDLTDSPRLLAFQDSFGFPESCIVSAVRHIPEWLLRHFEGRTRLIILDHSTPLPFAISYSTPETLGRDRIAAVAAAWKRFPDRNVLVIDMGTCITYDLLTAKGVYEGGAISPGLHMRFKALHSFTEKLPLIDPESPTPFVGKSTTESIRSGVMHGIQAEIDQTIASYEKIYEDLTVYVGGGDNKYFDKQLKYNIFAGSNLVVEGLKVILDFNEFQ
ncbi:MAG: type III pantothenate kinase [Bacteroidetes bacterium]|nr:type III pantothenate kinase [Bacteroidales bacterium]MBU1010340.1 type III pantothenate kinase [Bacteroidota bacterium]